MMTNMPLPPNVGGSGFVSDSKPAITFGFGGHGGVVNLITYTKLAFAVFYRGYYILLLGSSSLSSSTGTCTKKDTADLWAAQYFLGTYGGGRGVKCVG